MSQNPKLPTSRTGDRPLEVQGLSACVAAEVGIWELPGIATERSCEQIRSARGMRCEAWVSWVVDKGEVLIATPTSKLIGGSGENSPSLESG